MKSLLNRYFFWTYPRGSFHYDVMVTLILLFIFVTPHLWNYGDKPSVLAAPSIPITVIGDGDHGLVITIQAEAVKDAAPGNAKAMQRAFHRAIEPVTGDAVTIDKWKPATESGGNVTAWRVWAHR